MLVIQICEHCITTHSCRDSSCQHNRKVFIFMESYKFRNEKISSDIDLSSSSFDPFKIAHIVFLDLFEGTVSFEQTFTKCTV